MKNEILKSWNANAKEWIKLIDDHGIASRKITNERIIQAVNLYGSGKMLDLGCGEGWLVRSLSKLGKDICGCDGTLALIEKARQSSDDLFYHMRYEDLIQGQFLPGSPFDTIIFNYCLYLKDQVEELLRVLHAFLAENGKIIIQTVHPYFLIKETGSYKSQWINDAWKGLNGKFDHPHKWYARTLIDWIKLFKNAKFMYEIKETIGDDGMPISIIFTLSH